MYFFFFRCRDQTDGSHNVLSENGRAPLKQRSAGHFWTGIHAFGILHHGGGVPCLLRPAKLRIVHRGESRPDKLQDTAADHSTYWDRDCG